MALAHLATVGLLACGAGDEPASAVLGAAPPPTSDASTVSDASSIPGDADVSATGPIPGMPDLTGGGSAESGVDEVPVPGTTNPIALSAVASPAVAGGLAALATLRGGAALAFAVAQNSATQIVAVDALGVVRGRYDIPDSAGQELVRGFDLDGDGVPDFGLIGAAPMAAPKCGAQKTRTLRVFAGKTSGTSTIPTLLMSIPVNDPCISVNGAAPTPYVGLAPLSIHFGAPGFLAVCPQYTDVGFLFRWTGTGVESLALVTPNTPAYDTTYAGIVQPTPQKTDGSAFISETQPLSGLLRSVGGNLAYHAVSSTRVLHYAWAPLGTSGVTALVSDRTYLGRTGLVGRNYGLFQVDDASQVFSRVGGVSVAEVTWQMRDSPTTVQLAHADLAGALERGLWTYDLAHDQYLATRFLGYVHDHAERGSYDNRVLHPARSHLPTPSGPRLVANIFKLGIPADEGQATGGHWEVHLTNPRGVDSAIVESDMIVWDLIPRGAGVVDVLASDIDPTLVYVPQYIDAGSTTILSWVKARYYPKPVTKVLRWTSTAGGWSTIATLAGLPYLDLPLPNRFDVLSTSGYRFGALVAFDAATHQKPTLWMRRANGAIEAEPITW
jgi:hypothetical protein